MQDIQLRPSGERGSADHGWLKSRHTFSFAEYYDPAHMGFHSLRVINQDRVAPAGGFPTHPHRDMEIFSYVVEGELRHEDSLGNSRTLKPGEIQLMSAGMGVTHSEFNPSTDTPLHFLQIWIQPSNHGLQPRYTEWKPEPGSSTSGKKLVISPDGRHGSAQINQDACVYLIRDAFDGGHSLVSGRGLWLQLITGSATVGEKSLEPGDGIAVSGEGEISIKTTPGTQALLFDLY